YDHSRRHRHPHRNLSPERNIARAACRMMTKRSSGGAPNASGTIYHPGADAFQAHGPGETMPELLEFDSELKELEPWIFKATVALLSQYDMSARAFAAAIREPRRNRQMITNARAALGLMLALEWLAEDVEVDFQWLEDVRLGGERKPDELRE